MRWGVIKTAFLAASLGWALFVSGPALAETDELLGECEDDADTGVLRLTMLSASIGVDLPTEVVTGAFCVEAIEGIKGVGFVPVRVFVGLDSSTEGILLDEPELEVLLRGPLGFLVRFVGFSYIRHSPSLAYPKRN